MDAPSLGEAVLLDLPGAVSLDPLSPDEQLTRDLVVEQAPEDRPDVVVVVASAVHLARGLYLLRQVLEIGARSVLVVTMGDVAARRGIEIDVEELSAACGVRTVAVDPRHGGGTTRLAAAVAAALGDQRTTPDRRPADDLEAAEERFAWVAGAVERATLRDTQLRDTWSDRLDRIDHRTAGRAAAVPRRDVAGVPGDDDARGAAAGGARRALPRTGLRPPRSQSSRRSGSTARGCRDWWSTV